MTLKDQRGYHNHHPTVSTKLIDSLHQLIGKIPKYNSHYKQLTLTERFFFPWSNKFEYFMIYGKKNAKNPESQVSQRTNCFQITGRKISTISAQAFYGLLFDM